MAIDFPNAPTVGQVFTSGGQSWTWDGAVWMVSSVPPNPGVYLPLTGGTMTGPIAGSPGAPTLAAHLTRKDYVDATVAAYLALTGGNLSGPLGIRAAVPTLDITDTNNANGSNQDSKINLYDMNALLMAQMGFLADQVLHLRAQRTNLVLEADTAAASATSYISMKVGNVEVGKVEPLATAITGTTILTKDKADSLYLLASGGYAKLNANNVFTGGNQTISATSAILTLDDSNAVVGGSAISRVIFSKSGTEDGSVGFGTPIGGATSVFTLISMQSALQFEADPNNLHASTAMYFKIDGVEAARLEAGGTLVATTALVTRSAGDARYLVTTDVDSNYAKKYGNNTFTGTQTISSSGPIIVFENTASDTDLKRWRVGGAGGSTNLTFYAQTDLGATLTTSFVTLLRDTLGVTDMRLTTLNPTLIPHPTSVLTRERADTRYLQIAGGVGASKYIGTEGDNLYPDYDVADAGFYASSVGTAYSLSTSSVTSGGAAHLSLPVDAASLGVVESNWFSCEISTEYVVSTIGLLATSGTGTGRVFIETGSMNNLGVITSLGRTLVLTRTDSPTQSVAAINLTTPATGRMMRFVVERDAGGNQPWRAGGFRVRRKVNVAHLAADVDARYLVSSDVDSNYAKLNAANTFTVNQLIQHTNPVLILNDTDATLGGTPTGNVLIRSGANTGANNQGLMGFNGSNLMLFYNYSGGIRLTAATAGNTIGFYVGNAEVGRLDDLGTLPVGASLITKTTGDARYLVTTDVDSNYAKLAAANIFTNNQTIQHNAPSLILNDLDATVGGTPTAQILLRANGNNNGLIGFNGSNVLRFYNYDGGILLQAAKAGNLIQFYVGATAVGILDDLSTLSYTASIVTRATGDARYATLNGNNTLAGLNTIESTAPSLYFTDTDASTNIKRWRLTGSGGSYQFLPLDDAGVTQVGAFGIIRDAGGVIDARLTVQDTTGALTTAQSVVTRERGDVRYATLAGGNALTGAQTVGAAFDTANAAGHGVQISDGSTAGNVTIQASSTSVSSNPVFQIFTGIDKIMRVEAGGGAIFYFAGLEAAKATPAGPSASVPTAIITREKGDARYLQIAGDQFVKALVHTTRSAGTTLNVTDISAVAINFTGTSASNLTLPLGTTLDSGFPSAAVDTSIDFCIINTGTVSTTVLPNTGVTILGSAVVAIGSSASFRLRKTATATWIAYRVN